MPLNTDSNYKKYTTSRLYLAKSLRERILVFTGSASLVIVFSLLLGWVGGSLYKWGKQKNKESAMEDIVRSENLSDSDKYIAILQQAIKEKPENETLRMHLAVAYYQKSKEVSDKKQYFNEAIIEAENAWDLFQKKNNYSVNYSDNNVFKLRLEFADILAECGKEKKAQKIYDELLTFLENNENAGENLKAAMLANFYNNIAYSLLKKENLSETDIAKADDLMKKCLKTGINSTSNPAFLDTLAYLFLKKGDKEKALKAAKESLAKVGKSHLFEYIKRYEYIEKNISDKSGAVNYGNAD